MTGGSLHKAESTRRDRAAAEERFRCSRWTGGPLPSQTQPHLSAQQEDGGGEVQVETVEEQLPYISSLAGGLVHRGGSALRPPSSPLDDCLYVTRGLEPPLQLCRYHHSLTPPQCQTVCPSVRIPSQILEMSSTVCSERAAPESLSF